MNNKMYKPFYPNTNPIFKLVLFAIQVTSKNQILIVVHLTFDKGLTGGITCPLTMVMTCIGLKVFIKWH